MCQLLICRRNTHTNTYVSKKKKTKTNTFDPISLMTPQTITHTSASNLHEKHTHNTSEKGIDIVSKIVRDRWIRGWSYQGHHFIFASIVPLGIATIWILLSTGSGQRRPWCRNYHQDRNIFCSSSRPHQHVYWPAGLTVNKRTCPQLL